MGRPHACVEINFGTYLGDFCNLPGKARRVRYELTLYDTEAREDHVREYTESRRRVAVWALMPRVQLGGSFHHLIYRVREYSSGAKKPELSLRRFYPEQEKALGDLHQKVREAKSLTGPQVELLTLIEEAGDKGMTVLGRHAWRTAARLESSKLVDAEGRRLYLNDKGREYLKLRVLP